MKEVKAVLYGPVDEAKNVFQNVTVGEMHFFGKFLDEFGVAIGEDFDDLVVERIKVLGMIKKIAKLFNAFVKEIECGFMLNKIVRFLKRVVGHNELKKPMGVMIKPLLSVLSLDVDVVACCRIVQSLLLSPSNEILMSKASNIQDIREELKNRVNNADDAEYQSLLFDILVTISQQNRNRIGERLFGITNASKYAKCSTFKSQQVFLYQIGDQFTSLIPIQISKLTFDDRSANCDGFLFFEKQTFSFSWENSDGVRHWCHVPYTALVRKNTSIMSAELEYQVKNLVLPLNDIGDRVTMRFSLDGGDLHKVKNEVFSMIESLSKPKRRCSIAFIFQSINIKCEDIKQRILSPPGVFPSHSSENESSSQVTTEDSSQDSMEDNKEDRKTTTILEPIESLLSECTDSQTKKIIEKSMKQLQQSISQHMKTISTIVSHAKLEVEKKRKNSDYEQHQSSIKKARMNLEAEIAKSSSLIQESSQILSTLETMSTETISWSKLDEILASYTLT